MTAASISHVRIAGIISAIPDAVLDVGNVAEAFGEVDARKISENTGIRSRHVAPAGVCTSDLCVVAAERVLDALAWPRASVDVIIVVSQTPDYVLPATACILQHRLGLAKSCASVRRVNLGCSGYTYGLWLASTLLASGGATRALLLVGDTVPHLVSPRDRAVAPLFGDAGTATALERDQQHGN